MFQMVRLLKLEPSLIVHPLPLSFPNAWLRICVFLAPLRTYEFLVWLDSRTAPCPNQSPISLSPPDRLARRSTSLLLLFNVSLVTCPSTQYHLMLIGNT